MQCCRIVNGIKNKNIKNSLEQCGMLRIWRRDCALCPKDKNLSPFHGEKPLVIK